MLFRTPWPQERVLSWAAQVSDMIGSGPEVGGAGGTSLCSRSGASFNFNLLFRDPVKLIPWDLILSFKDTLEVWLTL